MSKLEISMDWLSITFPVDGMDSEKIMHIASYAVGTRMPKLSWSEEVEGFGIWPHTSLKCVELERGFMGFTNSASLYHLVEGSKVVLGTLAWGGKSQKGRAYISMPGTGSQLVDPKRLHEIVADLHARITRIDIAVDDFQGKYPVSKAVNAYRRGGFNSGGRPPSAKFFDDLGNKTGNTLYVGKRENGKMLRAYQKGLQLRPGSNDPWVRYEVELHNTDRDIPADIGSRLAEFFLGAYHFLDCVFSKPLKACAEKISCSRVASKLIVDRMLDQFKKQNGRFLNLAANFNINPVRFLAELSKPGLPKKIHGHLNHNLIREVKQRFLVLPV